METDKLKTKYIFEKGIRENILRFAGHTPICFGAGCNKQWGDYKNKKWYWLSHHKQIICFDCVVNNILPSCYEESYDLEEPKEINLIHKILPFKISSDGKVMIVNEK